MSLWISNYMFHLVAFALWMFLTYLLLKGCRSLIRFWRLHR